MNLIITPARLSGTVTPPPSKSMAHRAVLAQALSENPGKLLNTSSNQDIQATERCISALMDSSEGATELPELDCGESGSTLRFLIPLALVLRGGGRFTGRGRLMHRPQKPYFDIFREKGILWKQDDSSLTVEGTLRPGIYQLPGDVSSQFVTGLLFALPLLGGDSEILLTSRLESRDYVDMTIDVLSRFGVEVESRGNAGFSVRGNQRFKGTDIVVEPDWSQAGFWYAARALGSDIEILGMDESSVQGDRVISEHFGLLTRPGDVTIDVSDCPDLAPPLAVMAAVRQGTTSLVNATRLRFKESDRISAIRKTLSALGAQVKEGGSSLIIGGLPALSGGAEVDCFGDHRIAMMAAVAATACEKEICLTGAECVAKSYPRFWEDYAALGGKIRGAV